MMFLVLELNDHRLFIFHKFNMATFKMAVQDGVPFLYFVQAPLCFHIFIGPAAIVEGNKDNFRSSQPPQINCHCGRRHTRVCEYATERLVY